MIEKIGSATRQLERNVDQAKQKITAQQVQVEQKQKAQKERIVALPTKQEDIIKQIIGEM